MKKLLLCLPLLLASCAPLYGVVQKDGASLAVTDDGVTFVNPGPGDARLPTLLIRGSVSVSDSRCVLMDAATVGCKLGTVLEGGSSKVAVKGRVTAASVTYYRAASGDRPIYLRWP